MAEKIVITGINGFVGEHTARAFKNDGFEVLGVGTDDSANNKVKDLLDEYQKCDLLNAEDVKKLSLKGVRSIIHLAGLSAVGPSFDNPLKYINSNPNMTFNLLDHAKNSNIEGRCVVVSSGALYDPNQTLPISEDSKTLPNSPYSISKLATEDVAEYFSLRGLDTVVVRPFNHIGPGQGEGFLLPDLYNQIVNSQNDEILVGNIKTKRDYTDVRDIVAGYKSLALAPTLKYQKYNMCSGESHSGEEILEILKNKLNKSNLKVNIDESKIRPNDIIDIRGDSSRIKNELNWQPDYNLEQTIEDFINSQG